MLLFIAVVASIAAAPPAEVREVQHQDVAVVRPEVADLTPREAGRVRKSGPTTVPPETRRILQSRAPQAQERWWKHLWPVLRSWRWRHLAPLWQSAPDVSALSRT